MSEEMKPCPKCQSPYGYLQKDQVYVCPECSFEWNVVEEETTNDLEVKDSNGNVLENGDTVLVIKNLPVKGASGPIKAGTKVKNIRLVDSDHNINCKIKGFGSMALKSEFVKKA